MKPGFFSRDMLLQPYTPTKLSSGALTRHTLGWIVALSDRIRPIYQKNGGRNNCAAWIGFAPLHKVAVAVAANSGEPDVDSIGLWLLERSVPALVIEEDRPRNQ